MKKVNLLTYAVFAAFVLLYWFMKKTGNPINSHSYLMVMVIVLFLLYIVRVILRFKRIRDYHDPYERTYDNDESISSEEPAQLNPFDDMKKTNDKRIIKKALFILIAIIGIWGFRYAARVYLTEMMLDGFESPEELFADIDKKRDFHAEWDEYREEEIANGGPTYLVEDIFASTLKPDHWKDFFVLTTLPDDFYFKNESIHWSSRGDHIIKEIFYDYSTHTEFIYFVQSADYEYNKAHVPREIKKEEGKFFKEDKGTRNQIIWFYDDLTLYLEGNIPLDELEQVAMSAVNYNELSYDYSAIEE